MTDTGKLPYLLELIDDDSPVVRNALIKEFGEFGSHLREELARLPKPVTPEQRSRLFELLEEGKRQDLAARWPGWMKSADDFGKLEEAYSQLSDYLAGPFPETSLGALLNELAGEYREAHAGADAKSLATFLFSTKGMRGTHEQDYYDPRNSNLIYVIEEKRGIPVSLASVYILTGARLGLEIGGCNYPGHFLARTQVEDKLYLVDCFNGGRFIEEKTLLNYNESTRTVATEVIHTAVDAETIIRRVLRNLIGAYQRKEMEKNAEFMNHLLDILENGPRS